MAVKFSSWGNAQFVIPSTGAPASGYRLYTYVAGSSTLVTTFTTNVGDVQQSNPIILNSAGFPTTGQIWLTEGSSIKIVFTDASDVVIKTEDYIPGVNDAALVADQWVSGPTPTYISATSFSLVGDQTSTFQVNRRVKTTNSGGTRYSTITASAFAALTTVTVVNDSGTLDAGLSAVSYGLLSATNPSVPPFSDTSPIVIGSIDPSKKVRLEVDGLTTGTTRVITMPDRNITLGQGLVQRGYAAYTSNATLATAIPFDDSIPQITEGVEILTVTITPTSASNRICIRFQGAGADSGGAAPYTAALFVGVTAGALSASTATGAGAGYLTPIVIEYEESAASTTERTYRLRVGPASGNIALNGYTGTRLNGGVMRSTLIVEEIV